MKKKIDAIGFLVGVFFLISSLAKAINADSFSDKILQYGIVNLFWLSPFIIFLEALVGILLVLKVYQKYVAFVGAVMVLLFTSVYAYGLWGRGVVDCGCLGDIPFGKASPLLIFIRNVILFTLLLFVWKKDQDKTGYYLIKKSFWVAICMTCFLSIVTFMSGYTLHTEKDTFERKMIYLKENDLGRYMQTSHDSTYIAFLFSYTCPHCLNSIANLNSYLSFGTVDHIVAFGVGDSIKESIFRKYFDSKIQLKTYTDKEISSLTKRYPTLYFIQRDTIMFEYTGELPCSYIMDILVHDFD